MIELEAITTCNGINLSVQRDVAQLGSALRSGRRGRGFESRHPDVKFKQLLK